MPCDPATDQLPWRACPTSRARDLARRVLSLAFCWLGLGGALAFFLRNAAVTISNRAFQHDPLILDAPSVCREPEKDILRRIGWFAPFASEAAREHAIRLVVAELDDEIASGVQIHFPRGGFHHDFPGIPAEVFRVERRAIPFEQDDLADQVIIDLLRRLGNDLKTLGCDGRRNSRPSRLIDRRGVVFLATPATDRAAPSTADQFAPATRGSVSKARRRAPLRRAPLTRPRLCGSLLLSASARVRRIACIIVPVELNRIIRLGIVARPRRAQALAKTFDHLRDGEAALELRRVLRH